ncbi:hypothetical protein C6Y14_26205 [Streptomyces dioscori]|uniref:Hint domain-containing protein n=1 Tax=Streptomyces dioscori TaxID=2109333 RepID=A0A2P8Q1T7_9ACTN|nr:hypothetical protein C6Y14_26205 [Streptomyces dioscori]
MSFGARTVDVRGLPLRVGPAKKPKARTERATALQAKVLGRAATRAAGIDGVAFTVSRSDGAKNPGSARVTLDYSGFADAYGGSYGSRLRLAEYPACVLTTPEKAGCSTPRALKSANSTAARTLAADVTVAPEQQGPKARSAASGATVLAATAAAGGNQGSFGATPLAPSSEWSVSNSSGAFNWSYPLRTPPAPGGLGPAVSLGYNSQSVDGQVATTNNQGSWIGQGFGYEPGFIERRYKGCADDGHAETNGDQCWAFDNATIQLGGGASGELIKDDETGAWRISSDDNSKVELLTGAANGDNDGEHWRVTTTDGTQYYFGLDNLPGFASGDEQTGSAWTVPVYGDDSGEPCYDATLADAHCQQAWRWNLDYVVDPHGNAMSYFYGKETNYYTQGLKTTENGKSYTRGGYLKRADYGQRAGSVYSTPAAARVVFTTDERCLAAAADCEPGDLTDATAAKWPDVPWDRNCKADTKCAGQNSPTFWTRKKLSKVTTQIRYGTGYADVDSWDLGHLFTDNGDGSKSLWLNTIKHTGHAGSGTAEMPSVELLGEQLPNRVDKPGDNIQAMNRFRLSAVDNDTGGQLDVVYRDTECTAGSLPAADASTKACYPVKWNPPGETDPITDWFHKYLVDKVVQTDLTGGAPDMVNQYTYLGDAGWKMQKADGISDDEYRTRSDWRGYGKVRVTNSDGSVSASDTRTEHTYLRGLGGTVTDSVGAEHTDAEELSGHELETATYNGAYTADKLISKTVNSAWTKVTATRVKSWGTTKAYYVRPAATKSYTAQGNDWIETSTTTRYDSATGRPTETDDYGRTGVSADNTCTRTTYADNSTAHILSVVARVEKVAVDCAGTPDRKTQVLSDDRTSYDGLAFGAPPVKGDPTKVERLVSHNGTAGTYQTVTAATPADFDKFGRPIKVTDPAGNYTTIEYTETDGLTTKKVETNPLTWTTTTEYVRSWGAPSAQVDMNGKRTDLAYDALGRMTSVWLPDRAKDDSTPSIKYSYLVRKTAPVAVRTQKIEKDGLSYGSEYALYDGLMRPRQEQTEGPGGGRMVADTFYDGVGRIVKANADYYTTGEPTDTVFKAVNGDTDAQSRTEYDGAGRKTADIFQVAGEEKWRTTYSHEADRVHVDPPAGTPPTTTITDAHGRTVEVRRYQGDKPEPTATTGFESMYYTYTPAGQADTVKDQAGNVWSYGYDQIGRKAWAQDPDTGKTLFEYDTMDRLLSTTDSRNKKISTKYDKLGRVLSTWEGEPDTGTKLTVNTYDSLPNAKGRSVGSYRYENGVVQATSVIAELDAMYQPTVTRVTLAGSQAAELKGTYEFGTQYNKDGTVQSVRMPAAGGLPAETLTTSYDDLQRPTSLTSSLGTSYVNAARYAPTSQLQQLELSNGGTAKKTWLSYAYERGTNRLTNTRVDYEGATSVAADTNYTYDPAGNIMSIADTPTGNTADVQCFTYDWQRRLSSAWTTTNASNDALGTGAKDAACASAPTGATIGGAAPYWQTFDYDLAGNRTKQILKGFGGKPDSTRTYTYGDGADGPHQLSTMTQSTPAHGTTPAVSSQDSFDYTEAGQTDVRVRDGNTQDLQWSAGGQLSKVVEGSETSSFLYDASGSRLVRKEPGAETLYLPGMELKLNTATRTLEGTRYYGFAGQTIAIRTPKGVQFLSGDHHGTMSLAVDAANGSITRRRMDPFGTPREPAGKPWVDDKGFLGKPVDEATGLTHIGAREYEPENGRFVSADPMIDFSDPQQINGYAYANNNPVTFSDPTGLMIYDEVSGLGFGNAQVLQNYIDRDPVRYGLMAQRDTTAVRKYNEAAAKASAAKARAIATAKELGSIIADELGITDALDCFTTGSLGSCGATAVNIASSMVGGAVGKLAAKYGLPWNWKKGIALGKRVSGLVGKLFSSFKNWMKWDDKAAALKGAADRGKSAMSALNAKIRKLPSCDNSFTPNTRVKMADGRTKAIKKVRIGDKVLAKDPKTGVVEAKLVTAEIKGKGAKKLVKVTIDVDGKKGAKTASVTATDNHPFWVPQLDEWIDATDLKTGQWLESGSGTRIQIAGVKRWTQAAAVHNLTVADVHTYYVLADATPVLVHNCGDAGYADVYLDMEQGHASIAVTHNSRTIHTEAGSQVGEDSIVGLRGASHSRGTDVIRVPLPNARRAQKAQEYFLDDNNLGPHDRDANNCVTFCARILKAGGYEMPVSQSMEIASWLLETNFERRRL